MGGDCRPGVFVADTSRQRSHYPRPDFYHFDRQSHGSAVFTVDASGTVRGRVSAVNSIFINTSNQLGEFESGLMAAWVGAVPAAAIGGIGTLIVVGLWMTWFPGLRKRQKLENEVVEA